MANTYGVWLQQYREKVMKFTPPGILRSLYDHMVGSTYINHPDSELYSYHAGNISGRSTRLCSHKNRGKTYVWYDNPWGYDDDAVSHSFDRK